MRIFFLWIVFTLVSQSYYANNKKDSLEIENIREEALLLAENGNLVESIEKIEFAIAQSKLANLTELFINDRLRIFLANRYSSIGDFDRAIELAKNLEQYYKRTGNLDKELYVKNNLGVYHQNIGRNLTAYNYFLDGWQLIKNSNETVDKLDLLDGLTASCIKLNRLPEAKQYLVKTEDLLQVCTSKLKEELNLYYLINISNYALAINDDTQAKKTLLQCALIGEKNNKLKGADAYRLLAKLFLDQGKYEQALNYAKRITILLGAHKDSSIKNPDLFQAYMLQAKALLALNDYEKAVLNCEKAEDQAIFFQHQYLFNESKLYIGKLRRENLETAIMALHHQYEKSSKIEYLEQALIFVDQAKSNLLNERWANLKMLSLDNRKEIIKWRYQLIFQINELKDKGNDRQSIHLRDKLDSLNNILGVKNEKNFSVKDLRAFQTNLKSNELYLEYMVIDTFIFRFDIQKNKINWNVETIKSMVHIFNFYSILKDPSSTPQDFIQASGKLPELLPSFLSKKTSIGKISIIPDGLLNYMVFDALPMNSVNESWKNIHYVAMNYFISYEFSIQSSKPIGENKLRHNYIGFAPDYNHSKEWATLKNSRRVMVQAESYFKGYSYFGNQATKSNLQKYSPHADLLHFYAHGVSNDSIYSSSYIVLQDDKVYVDEILALPLKAHLCVLTTCEAGLGKNYNGEGITGIAWAFKAAGVENVIQSMWKLNEQSSFQIMNYFFEYLSHGINSAVALTEAKRQYLKNPEISDRLKHPYYWVGIEHYGTGTTITKDTSDSWKILLGFIMLIGACLVAMKYTKKYKMAYY